MSIRRGLGKYARMLGLGSVAELYKNKFSTPIFTNQVIKSRFSSKTLLIAVEPYFNQNILNASLLTPLSFAIGWSRMYGPAKFISIKELRKEIDLHDSPAIFTMQNLFRHLSIAECKKLRGQSIFTWVHVHPNVMEKFSIQNPLIPKSENDLYLDSYQKLIDVEPKFVWNAVGARASHWFEGWVQEGHRWHTIFPGANTDLYFPDRSGDYADIPMAYVGGYWAEKSLGFDMYLKPWDELIRVYGYNSWPYKNYMGGIDENSERKLYTNSGLIPLIHGPMGWNICEITERYVKAPACRAFCIADHNSAVRELFKENELLQAGSPEEFHHLVNQYLSGKVDVEAWREAGYQAVIKRHLVEHRAKQIYDALF